MNMVGVAEYGAEDETNGGRGHEEGESGREMMVSSLKRGRDVAGGVYSVCLEESQISSVTGRKKSGRTCHF
jgi:hypothetical protein